MKANRGQRHRQYGIDLYPIWSLICGSKIGHYIPSVLNIVSSDIRPFFIHKRMPQLSIKLAQDSQCLSQQFLSSKLVAFPSVSYSLQSLPSSSQLSVGQIESNP